MNYQDMSQEAANKVVTTLWSVVGVLLTTIIIGGFAFYKTTVVALAENRKDHAQYDNILSDLNAFEKIYWIKSDGYDHVKRSLEPIAEIDKKQDADIVRLYKKIDENQKEILELLKRMK